MKNKSKIFKFSRSTWRITWIIAGILWAISWIIGHHFYYVYLYFIAVGLISFVNSLRKYVVISASGLSLYRGYFAQKPLDLKWDNVLDVKFDHLKETIRTGAFGESGVSAAAKEKVEVMAFYLKKPLFPEIQKKFGVELNYRFIRPNVSLNESGDVVYLINSPEKGFRRLLNSLADFIIVDEEPKESIPPIVYYLLESFIVLHVVLFAVLLYLTRSTT
ncbi:MAG: hypothetical protein FP816_07955 [Desulfobacteraceae bacterium]|nr:hypothetical protein [Desulfobacteraceae bacterium]